MGTDGTIASAPAEPSRPQHNCNQCTRWRGENARNLVVCIDGTSNECSQNHTNVVKLFSKINVDTTCPEQYAYYIGGIGTDPKSSHILGRIGKSLFDKFDIAVGRNEDKIIKDAYKWLAEMYQAGDQIYLFGFSRGAYQARVLVAMIYEVGLTTTSMQKQINRAYARYRAILSGEPEARDTAKHFRNLFSWDCLLRVHFVGVWDTISSVGLARRNHFLSASSSASHACRFRHALALDERRVKFMPLYFNEINARGSHGTSEYIVTDDTQHVAPHTNEQRRSDGVTKQKSDIKEVWFAGSHSDVGGVDRSRWSYNAGNVSLSWMRREAEASDLVLRPADTVWVPNDLDFGVSDSMTSAWKIIECMPIKHQVSFSGGGVSSRCWHRLQPRRIVPGQKIHASILYAITYKPRASLGEGFEIPTVHTGLDTKLDSQLWEIGLFDAAAAKEIMACLGDQQGVAPIYLDRLLFILRFQEGKQCVRNVPKWQDQFLHLIHNRCCAPLVRLVTIVAYYEASCDSDIHPENLSLDIFQFAKKYFSAVLAAHKHRDLPRVISLIRPMTRHQILREHILTQDVLETFVELLDAIIYQTGENIHQAMDGLTCLLQCKHTQGVIIEKLGGNLPSSNVIRLSRILDVKDSRLLISVLRMVMTLARIPEGKPVCLTVKPRLKELAKTDKRLVGKMFSDLLSLPTFHILEPQSIRNANARANVAGALVRLSQDRRNSTDGEGRDVDPGLRHLFGVDAAEFTDRHKMLIMKLKSDIQQSNVQRRTVSTLAVLNLCQTEVIRTFLCEVDLLRTFINQMKHKDSALLAAYALATCLEYEDMKQSIQNDRLLPKHIVDMFRLDYFDDGIGQVEGFQVFEDFMRHSDLRQRIKDHNIIEVLSAKLVKGEPKDTRTSLVCLDILCASSKDGLLLRELVAKGLDCLRSPIRKVQNAGVAILCSLAQTECGVEIIGPRMCDIIKMLLPDEDFLIIPSTMQGTTTKGTTLSSDTEEQTPVTQEGVDSWLPRSQMMRPARALLALAKNEMLQKATRHTKEYRALRYLYLSGVYMDKANTSLWRGNGLDHAVIDVLGKLIERIDETS